MRNPRLLLASFVAGILSAALIVALTGNKMPALMFAAGFAVAVAIALVSLGSAARLHAAAARLDQLALWIDAKPPRRPAGPVASNKHREGPAEPTGQPHATTDPRHADLVSALMNLGSRKSAANAAARWAIDHSAPSAELADLVRVALRAPAAQKVAA